MNDITRTSKELAERLRALDFGVRMPPSVIEEAAEFLESLSTGDNQMHTGIHSGGGAATAPYSASEPRARLDADISQEEAWRRVNGTSQPPRADLIADAIQEINAFCDRTNTAWPTLRALRDRLAAASTQPPAPEYVAVIRKIRAHTSYTRPSVACELIDRIAVICDEALGITNAPAICKEPGCGQALEPYAGCPAHDRATSTKEV